MDEKLLPYFENINDGTAQSQFLEVFGTEKVQNGICLNLVLAWIHFYKNNVNKAPNLVWNEMKNPNTLKQIARNHEQYTISDKNPIDQLSINDIINLYNLSSNNYVSFQTSDDLNLYIPACLRHSSISLIILDFTNQNSNKIIAAHAIGLIKHNNKIYIYDPNVGVLSVLSGNLTELLNKIHYIYEEKYKYRIQGRGIHIIQ